jgi:2-polyprenyl-6-methoxyphenol hydroxylase-like FAD-dependent oxidoreductase
MFSNTYLPAEMRQDHTGSGAGKDGLQENKPLSYDATQASLMVGMIWERDPNRPDIRSEENKKDAILEKLWEAGWHDGFKRIVEALNSETIYVLHPVAATSTPVDWRHRARMEPENQGNVNIGCPRVWLIGDAIHPMLPSRGMGANQALHDTADALACILRLAKLKTEKGVVTDRDVEIELEKYEGAMIPRSMQWVKKSGGTMQYVSCILYCEAGRK